MARNKIYIPFLVFLGTILLNGCLLNSKNNDAEQTISSEDGLFSITIPAGWTQITDYGLNDVADIQAKKGRSIRYMIVVTDPKEDLVDYTFDEWREEAIESTFSGWEDGKIVSETNVIIDGKPAKQYEFMGIIERAKISLLATYVDGEKYFAQILTWTTTSGFKSSKEEFEKITNSIKGLN
jgi:hypothetical protein